MSRYLLLFLFPLFVFFSCDKSNDIECDCSKEDVSGYDWYLFVEHSWEASSDWSSVVESYICFREFIDGEVKFDSQFPYLVLDSKHYCVPLDSTVNVVNVVGRYTDPGYYHMHYDLNISKPDLKVYNACYLYVERYYISGTTYDLRWTVRLGNFDGEKLIF